MRGQQIKLLILWFFFTFGTFAFLFATAMMQSNEMTGGTVRLVQWLGIVTSGTLLGMILTMIMQEKKPELKHIPAASLFIFRLTVFLCTFYWIIAIATILLWRQYDSEDNFVPLSDWLFAQLPWLTFLQAGLLALLAYFFNKVRKDTLMDQT